MSSRPRAHEPSVDASRGQGIQAGDVGTQHNTWIAHQHVHAASHEVSWPVQVGRPPLLAEAFQPRLTLWRKIQSGLDAGPTVLRQTFAGDGGIGKSQLAAAVFAAAREVGIDLLVWVNAATREAIEATYALARESVTPAPGSFAEDAGQQSDAFLAWLATTDRSWLVVLDDVGDPADMVGLWPTGSRGRVLVTTRRRDAAVTGPTQTLVNVGVFEPQESLTYLREKLEAAQRDGRVPAGTLDGAQVLADELGHLPLALAQAAAVVLDDGITCGRYRALFADRSRHLAELFPDTSPADEYSRTVGTTWSLAIDRADSLHPPRAARRALLLGAVVDPNGTPDTLWTTEAARAYLGAAGPGAAQLISEQDAWRSLRNLHRLSLVTHEPGAGPRAVRIHALVQRTATDHLADSAYASLVRTAADALLQAWPDIENDPGLGLVLRQNADALSGRHPVALWQPQAHYVLFRAGLSAGEAGLADQARAYFDRLHTECLRVLGPDHPSTLAVRHNLASWRGQTGDAAGAAQAYAEVLTDRLRVLGPNHPDTLATRANLARWRGAAGDTAGAAQAFAHLLTDQLRVLGPDHPDTLAARHELAHWRGEAGDTAGAAQAFAHLLTDQLRVLGPDHPYTLATQANLARWRGEAGDPAGAVEASAALLTDRLRVLGPDHPNTLGTRHELAHWRGEAGDPARAAEEFAVLLTDRLRVLGPDHPHTLATRAHLARWRGESGQAAAAARALQELVADRLRILGPDHPDTLIARSELFRWRGEAGEAAAAAEAFAALLSDRLRVLGPDHPDTLSARHKLAYWRGETGDTASAAHDFAALLTDRLRVLGPDHPHTLVTRAHLAHWRGQDGEASWAAQALATLLADQQRILSPDHPDILITTRNLAYWRRQICNLPNSGNAAGFS
jgi:NB-ARC domain/Tetratricopeptide repeat